MDRENLSEIQNKTVLLLGFWKSAYQFMATERRPLLALSSYVEASGIHL